MEELRARMSEVEDQQHPGYIKLSTGGFFDHRDACGIVCAGYIGK